MRFLPQLSASRRLMLLALVLAMGIGAMVVFAVRDMRATALWYSARASANLAHSLQEAVALRVGGLDQSILGVVEGLADPRIQALPPELRRRVLFDAGLRSSSLTDVLVLDAQGNVVLESDRDVPRQANLADRDYFRALATGGHQGLFVGLPVRSRWSDTYGLPMARAYSGPDGKFAGVVVGAIRLDYFNELFAAVRIGPNSSLNLLRTDGVLVARLPRDQTMVGRTLSHAANFDRLSTEPRGDFVAAAVLDGVQRHYAFERVEGYPLVVSVGQSLHDLLGAWRRNASLLGGFAALLVLACLGLGALFLRELERRRELSKALRGAQSDLKTILDNLPSMVSYWDTDLRNHFANRASTALFGHTPETLKGMRVEEALTPEDLARIRPYADRALQGETQVFERVLVDPDGHTRYLQASYVPDFGGEGGAVRGLFVQLTDISDRKRMEDELFQEKERMRLTLQSIGDAVVCTDARGRISYMNPKAVEMSGWQAFDAADCNVDEVIPLLQSGGEVVWPSPVRVALAARNTCGPTPGLVLQGRGGQLFDVQEVVSPLIDRHGELMGTVMVLHDVTEARALTERMAHLAQFDALTDLPNRLLLKDRARQALATAYREDWRLGVVYLDLDGFKGVNDRLGHDAGDQLLVQLAQRLVATMRASDTVARLGGDEFMLLLPGLGGEEQRSAVARKLLGICREPFVVNGQPIPMGLSAGMALFPDHGTSFDELTRAADTAMYAAKRAGRLQVYCYGGRGAEPQPVIPR